MSIGNVTNYGSIYPTSGSQSSGDVVSYIREASNKTGIDFDYLLNQAKAESSLNPDAKASTSSATGLYQFIDSTWISMIQEHGSDYGLDEYVQYIDENGNITDPEQRQMVLDLRYDAEISSCMAAELASDNQTVLSSKLGDTEIGATELYLSHFMGASKAANFLQQLEENPDALGCEQFSREANANYGVFYDRSTGEARTLSEIYDFFDNKFQTKSETEVSTTQLAESSSTSSDVTNTNVSSESANYLYKSLFTNMSNSQNQLAAQSLFASEGASSWSNWRGFSISPEDILTLSELSSPFGDANEDEESRYL